MLSAAQPDADRSFSRAEQPAAMLQAFMDAWEDEKNTDDYKQRVHISQRNTEERNRLKDAAHEARRDFLRRHPAGRPEMGRFARRREGLAGELQLGQTPTRPR